MCPKPPNSTNLSAFTNASSKVLTLYMANTGDNFSCEKGSPNSTDVTSPIKIFVASSTFIPAIAAISTALCPTIFEFNLPSITMTFFIASVSFLLKI